MTQLLGGGGGSYYLHHLMGVRYHTEVDKLKLKIN